MRLLLLFLLCPGGADELVDLAGAERAGLVALGLLTDDFQNFGLWGGELDVVADAEEDGAGGATLLNDEGAALGVDAVEELTEVCAGGEGGDYD